MEDQLTMEMTVIVRDNNIQYGVVKLLVSARR